MDPIHLGLAGVGVAILVRLAERDDAQASRAEEVRTDGPSRS